MFWVTEHQGSIRATSISGRDIVWYYTSVVYYQNLKVENREELF